MVQRGSGEEGEQRDVRGMLNEGEGEGGERGERREERLIVQGWSRTTEERGQILVRL